ncbi:tRNA-splicing endonuclease subunit Sen2 [Copidosoma floridanum]|uniref:tRNA-splicing endonuclease subunit Sen2 n=1 Tax=Copidosoma floridanum TaxID=29053 RepID=UPI0006C9D700|nr:tRNA-splicing endonuclease subunit Sen2 [Copidosoma floridanum]
MELKEPKRKKRARSELKSSLPLVFGSKGELTQFHATLTYLGSCIADPTEMEIVYKMGYFGKGSLSKSHPKFGRINYGAPPIIRKRQWERREEWINEVQKLSKETFFDDDIKNDNSQSSKDEIQNAEEKSSEINDIQETLNSSCDTESVSVPEAESNKVILEKLSSNVEILNSSKQKSEHNNQTNGQNNQTDMEIDEVVLDSNEEEDICEISNESFNINSDFDKDEFFGKSESNDNYNKNSSELQEKVLVLPDSDSETDDYLVDIKPQVKDEKFPVRETLHLTFEETFFLMYGLGCLRVVDFDGKYLSIKEVWNCFCKDQKNFLQKYVTYHYFRSKGWVVKPGLKYGGDFVLYKEGPPFYHSSYIVIIDVLDAVTFKRIESKVARNITWNKFIGLERLAEAVGKEVLFAQVLWPTTVSTDTVSASPDVLSQFTVREILWKRWKFNQDESSAILQETADESNEDDYSS